MIQIRPGGWSLLSLLSEGFSSGSSRSEVKAISLPSGDQSGPLSCPEVVRDSVLPVDVRQIQRSSRKRLAIQSGTRVAMTAALPSGESRAERYSVSARNASSVSGGLVCAVGLGVWAESERVSRMAMEGRKRKVMDARKRRYGRQKRRLRRYAEAAMSAKKALETVTQG